MWALLPPQPFKPWHPATVPPPHRQSTAVNNPQEKGVFGRRVIAALKSDGPELRNSAKSNPKTTAPQTEKKQQLSGADVLMALQSATFDRKTKKTKVTANSGGGNRDKSGKKNEVSPDFSSVRPLRIKAEWNDQLEQLESRLQQLLHV